MNERKPVRTAIAGEEAARPDATRQQPLSSEATMHTDAQVRRAGGRLSREDQRRLGDILQRVYDEVLRQGVPDRFRDLLDQFDRTKEVGDAETMRGQAQGEPDHLVRAKAFDKGSRS
jgi:Anti-sigma factor NepR